MGFVNEVSAAVFKHSDAVKGTVVGAGLLACAGGYSAYEMAAQYVGYADAPLFCAVTGCLLPITAVGVSVGGVRLARSGRLSQVFPAIDRIRREIYGGTAPVVPPDAVLAVSETAVSDTAAQAIHDPVAMLAGSLHLLLVGYTGGGKTTLMHALAMHQIRQGNPVIVFDPDAAPGLWRDCVVVGAGDNFAQMDGMIEKLAAEVAYRRELRAQGQRDFEHVFVIMDEYADVHKECPEAREFVEGLLRRGRKLGIHLFLGVQDRLVRTMGFEGQGELRRNFTYVVDVMVDQATGERKWRLEQNNDRQNAVEILAPRLPNLDRLIIPSNIDGTQGGLVSRLHLSPLAGVGRTFDNGRVFENPRAVPETGGRMVATVPVPDSRAGGDFSPETAVSRPKPAETGVGTAGGNGNGFPAGTAPKPAPKPLTADIVASYMEKRFVTHTDFADPPPSLDQDKAVAIALCLHAGMSQNATMRAIYGTAGGRYREYVRLVEKHLAFLQKVWQQRQGAG